jgi:hypothetical protein
MSDMAVYQQQSVSIVRIAPAIWFCACETSESFFSGQTLCGAQIGFGPFVATSTSKRVAVSRRVPAIIMSGSDNGRCCSASASRRVLTLKRSSTSRKIA